MPQAHHFISSDSHRARPQTKRLKEKNPNVGLQRNVHRGRAAIGARLVPSMVHSSATFILCAPSCYLLAAFAPCDSSMAKVFKGTTMYLVMISQISHYHSLSCSFLLAAIGSCKNAIGAAKTHSRTLYFGGETRRKLGTAKSDLLHP